jgi:histidyl-tRNA synthetase
MRDVLPDEVELRDATITRIVSVYRSYGFRRIETPALEHLGLLVGSEGGENEKLIFKVLKRGEELEAARRSGEELADLGLRFDLTVPLARYYAENHARLPDPLKAIQIGPVWRAERPQRGRFRQFTQCDIDVVGGVASPVVEIELILATTDALSALGLRDLTVRLNDRRVLAALARDCGFPESAYGAFFIAFDKLDKIGPEGVLAELRGDGHDAAALRAFEAVLPSLHGEVTPAALRSAVPGAPAEALASLTSIVDVVNAEIASGCRVTLDPTLVRGMGYYTGAIFEITAAGYPSSIAGGGRYDRMVGRLLGRDAPASGFSIGFERLIAILTERGGGLPPTARGAGEGRRVALLVDDTTDLAAAVRAAKALRADGDLVSLEIRRKNVKKQLDDLLTHGFHGYATDVAAARPAIKPLTRDPERR